MQGSCRGRPPIPPMAERRDTKSPMPNHPGGCLRTSPYPSKCWRISKLRKQIGAPGRGKCWCFLPYVSPAEKHDPYSQPELGKELGPSDLRTSRVLNARLLWLPSNIWKIRSDGPRTCSNNPGWRSSVMSDAAMTMPRHAVIAEKPAGGHEHRIAGAGHQRHVARSHPLADAVPTRLPRSARSCKRSSRTGGTT